MLTAADVGRRVSVRRLEDGAVRDAVGFLIDLSDAELRVLRKDGEVTVLDPGTVTDAKVVPDQQPVPRGWAVPVVSPADMQAICSAGWPAREVDRLGAWQLRAHDGITGRANSAMAVGDPGLPLDEALDEVARWYGARGLPPLLQLPLADPANQVMVEHGWERLHVTIVQVAPAAPLLARLPQRDDLTVEITPAPGEDWQSLMHDLDEADPASHLEILTGPPVVGFATLRRDGAPVGIGRVSVEGPWAGITSVDVVAAARRQGIGSAVMGALVGWAQQQGAEATYLQVRAGNDSALRLYAALGYVTHHPYCYRAPVS